MSQDYDHDRHHDLASREHGIATIAHGFGDERRVRMLLALQDGRALSATHLAIEAGIAPSTASVHLRRLLDAGLIRDVPSPSNHGRHRFFALAGSEVAALCESLSALVPHEPVRSLKMGTAEATMRAGRTCYDHLAGRLSVELLDALVQQELMVPHDAGFAISGRGEQELTRFGIDLPTLRAGKRPVIRQCVDWSEQRPHLSGSLGKELLLQIETRGWIRRSVGDRSVVVTVVGHHGFRSWFGLDTMSIETLAHVG